jgi:hypothetical protein
MSGSHSGGIFVCSAVTVRDLPVVIVDHRRQVALVAYLNVQSNGLGMSRSYYRTDPKMISAVSPVAFITTAKLHQWRIQIPNRKGG